MRYFSMKLVLGMLVVLAAFHANPAWSQMDHDEMKMQGGSAPADARDPHAYSDGYTLTEGPYSRPGPRELKMADEHAFWAVIGDRLEYSKSSKSIIYDLQGWYGTTFDRFVAKAEGEIADGRLQENQTDLLWSHAVSAFFDRQLGVRFDQYDKGKNRQWLALGMQGLAELLFTQRLILQPRAELRLHGKNDPDNRVGKGLSNVSVSLRLRYEFTRQFAPYIGVEWSGSYGDTADYKRATGEQVKDTQIIAGLRFWF